MFGLLLTLVPLMLFLIPVFLVLSLVNLSRQSESATLIGQEMSWLFGENWEETAAPEHYLFAQRRIYRRRNLRWLFLFYMFPSLCILSAMFLVGISHTLNVFSLLIAI